MTFNAPYKVTCKIKTHTSPLHELIFDRVGRFVKETPHSYVFDTFAVRKNTVLMFTPLTEKEYLIYEI